MFKSVKRQKLVQKKRFSNNLFAKLAKENNKNNSKQAFKTNIKRVFLLFTFMVLEKKRKSTKHNTIFATSKVIGDKIDDAARLSLTYALRVIPEILTDSKRTS